MSLDWNSERCKLGSEAADDTENNDRYMLIWSSIGVDLGRITEANKLEWFVRLKVLERMGIAIFPGVDDEVWVRALNRWEGLSTNVADMTRTKWLNKVKKIVMDETIRHAGVKWRQEAAK